MSHISSISPPLSAAPEFDLLCRWGMRMTGAGGAMTRMGGGPGVGGGGSNSHVTNTLQLTKHFHVFLGTQACQTIYGMPSGSQALPKPRMEFLIQVFFSHVDLTDPRDMGSKQITTPHYDTELWHAVHHWIPASDRGMLTDGCTCVLLFKAIATVDPVRQTWAHLIWKPAKFSLIANL